MRSIVSQLVIISILVTATAVGQRPEQTLTREPRATEIAANPYLIEVVAGGASDSDGVFARQAGRIAVEFRSRNGTGRPDRKNEVTQLTVCLKGGERGRLSDDL